MLYLEDYLEMIEHLPQELRDRLTEMREMDLQVQNSADSLEKRVRTFFGNAKRMKLQEKDAEYDSIKKDYYKTLEDADEKVQLANQMYDLVARYVRRLEQETHNFKLELEADHMGITEILEKRSQELDSPPTPNSGNSSQKENRYSVTSTRTTHQEKRRDSASSNEHMSNSNKRMNVDKILPDIRLPAAVAPVLLAGAQSPATGAGATVNYTLGHISAGGTAIAAAASQAIAATQQMQQGRRTASLKASYEAIHSAAAGNNSGGGAGGGGVVGGVGVGGGSSSGGGGSHGGHAHQPHEISISKEIAGAAQTAIAAIQDTHKKHKKKNTSLASGTSSPAVASPVSSLQVQQPLSPTDSSEKNSETYDPNEPRYCVCNEVAFGGMVACDNKKCPFEWYHYPCVGITEAPKGKWYCQLCSNSSTIKKRGARKTMSQC